MDCKLKHLKNVWKKAAVSLIFCVTAATTVWGSNGKISKIQLHVADQAEAGTTSRPLNVFAPENAVYEVTDVIYEDDSVYEDENENLQIDETEYRPGDYIRFRIVLSPAKDGRYFNENRDDRSVTITTDFSETTVLNSDVNEDGQLVVRVKYGPVVYRLQTPENVAFSQADSKILTWNEVPEASGYEVQLMKGDQVIKTITTGRVASCNIGGAGTEGIDGSCYARVKAVPVGTAQKRYLYESGYGVTSTAIDGSSLGTQGQWVNDQGTWRYRLPDNRYYRDGWLEVDGSWYYFDKTTAAMQTGWIYTEDGKWYFLEESGRWNPDA